MKDGNLFLKEKLRFAISFVFNSFEGTTINTLNQLLVDTGDGFCIDYITGLDSKNENYYT